MVLGKSSEPQLPVSHMSTRVNNQYTYNHPVPTQSFCFSLSAQHSINYMSFSTLYYKIGFVGNSLTVQWLGLHAFTAEGTGSVPGWGTKIPQAVWCSQKKEKRKKIGFVLR